MKLSSNEARLLAKEIYSRVQKKNSSKVPPELIKNIKAFKEKLEELKKEETAACVALEEHENTWDELGIPKGIYGSDSIARICQKIKDSQVPTIVEITDAITLKALFNKDEDMETFISNVTKQFQKKDLVKQ